MSRINTNVSSFARMPTPVELHATLPLSLPPLTVRAPAAAPAR